MGSRLLLLLQERFSSLVEKDDLDEVLKSKDDILRWTVELTKYLVRPALPLCDDCASMHCSALLRPPLLSNRRDCLLRRAILRTTKLPYHP